MATTFEIKLEDMENFVSQFYIPHLDREEHLRPNPWRASYRLGTFAFRSANGKIFIADLWPVTDQSVGVCLYTLRN